MKNFRKNALVLLTAILFANLFLSCEEAEKSKGEYSNGVFIVNEGTFGNDNGSVSFYSNTADSVFNDIFNAVNGRSLGDVVQSLTVSGEYVYIVVNNSNKIEVADKNTMEEIEVIENLSSPRYIVVKNAIGYVSCWGDNSIKIVDLNTFTVTGSITSQGAGPEKMHLKNDKLYVINSGGFGNDSTVTVINTTNNSVIKNIQVPYNPKDIVEDNSGNLWILSYGNEIYNDDWTAIIGHTPSYLYKIDPTSDEVVAWGELFAEQHPAHLEIDNDGTTMYVGGGYSFAGIYKVSVSNTNLTLNEISTDYFYGFNVDPNSGVIFGAIAGDYVSPGTLKRLETDGTLLGTYKCGIVTSSAAFKNTK